MDLLNCFDSSKDLISNKVNRENSKAFIFVICLITILLVVFYTYYPVLSAQAKFLDDDQYYVKNELVQNPSWKSVKAFFNEIFFPSTVAGYYQPMAMISLMLDIKFGANTNDLTVFHITSLILHLVNVVLIFILVYYLYKKVIESALAALIFGLHPTAVESVAWVSERKTLLSMTFVLLSIILYVLYIKKSKRALFWSSILMFTLSLLSKPTSITLPILLLFIDIWPLNRFSKKVILEKIIYFELAIAFAVITYISQKYTATIILPFSRSLSYPFILVGFNIAFYINKIILPFNVAPFYPFPEPFSFKNELVVLYTVECFFIIIFIIMSLKKTNAVFISFSFFFISIFPVLGIISFTPVIAADRFLYFPIVGFIILLPRFMIWLQKIIKNKRVIILGIGVLIFMLFFEGALTHKYISYWNTTETLFRWSHSMFPTNALTNYHLGNALLLENKYEEAEYYFNESIKYDKNYTNAYNSIGIILYRQGKNEEAKQYFMKSLEVNPDDMAKYYLQLIEAYK